MNKNSGTLPEQREEYVFLEFSVRLLLMRWSAMFARCPTASLDGVSLQLRSIGLGEQKPVGGYGIQQCATTSKNAEHNIL